MTILRTTTICLALALSAFAAAAAAGQRYGAFDVVVKPAYRNASGGVGAARYTDDDIQYISCTTTMSTDLSTPRGSCQARTRSGVVGGCSTGDAQMIDTMRSLGPASYLSFVWSSAGVCTSVSVTNGSPYLD